MYQFGVNTLPVVSIPPVDNNYITPAGHQSVRRGSDRQEAARLHVDRFRCRNRCREDWLFEAAWVGSHGRRLSKRYNAYSNVTPACSTT